MNDDDPLATLIDQTFDAGWQLVPHVGPDSCTNALIFLGGTFRDVVTIPQSGPSTVVRLGDDGPRLGYPRQVGREEWRHVVPIRLALDWVLSGPRNDDMLIDPRGDLR